MTRRAVAAGPERQKLVNVFSGPNQADYHAGMLYRIICIKECRTDGAHVMAPRQPAHVLKPTGFDRFDVIVQERDVRRQATLLMVSAAQPAKSRESACREGPLSLAALFGDVPARRSQSRD